MAGLGPLSARAVKQADDRLSQQERPSPMEIAGLEGLSHEQRAAVRQALADNHRSASLFISQRMQAPTPSPW